MRDEVVFTALFVYLILLIYAGFGAPYRDVEDFANQLSHVAITIALAATLFIEERNQFIAECNKALLVGITLCNTAMLIDDFRKGSYSQLTYHDFIFPGTTLLILTPLLAWKLRKKS